MAWETIWRYKQKAYSGDFMTALSQQWSTSERNREFESVFFFFFFPRTLNSEREMTLAAHWHQVMWCPGHSRWRRKSWALHGKSGGRRLATDWRRNVGNVIGAVVLLMTAATVRAPRALLSKSHAEWLYYYSCYVQNYSLPKTLQKTKVEDVLTSRLFSGSLWGNFCVK